MFYLFMRHHPHTHIPEDDTNTLITSILLILITIAFFIANKKINDFCIDKLL